MNRRRYTQQELADAESLAAHLDSIGTTAQRLQAARIRLAISKSKSKSDSSPAASDVCAVIDAIETRMKSDGSIFIECSNPKKRILWVRDLANEFFPESTHEYLGIVSTKIGFPGRSIMVYCVPHGHTHAIRSYDIVIRI